MIKESIKTFRGFTLIELLVGVMIASIASIAIIYATIYIQTRNYELRVKDSAYEELKSYTEFWKGKIAANNISTSILSDIRNVCLIEDDNGICLHNATLSSDIILINTGAGTNVNRKGLKTKIEWATRSGSNQEIEFYIEQLVF